MENASKKLLFDALGYKPHSGQLSVHNLIDDYPVVTAIAGRRMGKTYLSIYEGIYQALQAGDNAGPPTVYIVSDTYAHSRKIFLPMLHQFETNKLLSRFLDKAYRKDQIITLKGGAEIYAKSADTPQSLAGDSVSFAVIDEAGYVNDEAMDILRPAFAARKNPRRISVGTPDRNDTFFKREADFGESDSEEYATIYLPSSVNPLVSDSYLEKERKMHSDQYYRRMYLAEFSSIDGAPFGAMVDNLELVEGPRDPVEGHRYVAGVDLADRQDYTVVVIIDVSEKPAKLVFMDRWRGYGYEKTGEKIAELLKRYNNAYAYADRTGVGDAAIGFITRHYGNVQPVVMTMQEKQSEFDIIYSALEKGDLLLYNERVLLNELRNLKAIQRSKGISYEAPKGLHDDAVMALFLAGRGLRKRTALPRRVKIGGFRV